MRKGVCLAQSGYRYHWSFILSAESKPVCEISSEPNALSYIHPPPCYHKKTKTIRTCKRLVTDSPRPVERATTARYHNIISKLLRHLLQIARNIPSSVDPVGRDLVSVTLHQSSTRNDPVCSLPQSTIVLDLDLNLHGQLKLDSLPPRLGLVDRPSLCSA